MTDKWEPSEEIFKTATDMFCSRGTFYHGIRDGLIAAHPLIIKEVLERAAAALRSYPTLTGDYAAKCVLALIPKVGE